MGSYKAVPELSILHFCFINYFCLDYCEYSTVNFIPEKLCDMYFFNARDNVSIFIDTIFEICNHLDLTDTTTCQNLYLHGINGKHPEFSRALF